MSVEKYARCVHCSTEFSRDELASRTVGWCPVCKHKGVPCAIEDDVTVNVNWHELRILGMWAENHAARFKAAEPSMQRTVAIIAGRLHAQHPEKPPLTLSGEIADLRQALPDNKVEVHGFDEDDEANAA